MIDFTSLFEPPNALPRVLITFSFPFALMNFSFTFCADSDLFILLLISVNAWFTVRSDDIILSRRSQKIGRRLHVPADESSLVIMNDQRLAWRPAWQCTETKNRAQADNWLGS